MRTVCCTYCVVWPDQVLSSQTSSVVPRRVDEGVQHSAPLRLPFIGWDPVSDLLQRCPLSVPAPLSLERIDLGSINAECTLAAQWVPNESQLAGIPGGRMRKLCLPDSTRWLSATMFMGAVGGWYTRGFSQASLLCVDQRHIG